MDSKQYTDTLLSIGFVLVKSVVVKNTAQSLFQRGLLIIFHYIWPQTYGNKKKISE